MKKDKEKQEQPKPIVTGSLMTLEEQLALLEVPDKPKDKKKLLYD